MNMKQIIKKGIITTTLVATLITGIFTPMKVNAAYENLDYKVLTPEKLTKKKLTHRKGKDIVYVEKNIGIVTNKKKDGKVLNARDVKYNYISYKRVKGAKKGDLIITYCYFNPYTNYIDDIWKRVDVIVPQWTQW